MAGELDVATAPRIVETVRELLAEGNTCIVVDLDDVTFMDAAALGALIAARRAVVAEGGHFAVTPNRRCERLQRMTGISGFLATYRPLTRDHPVDVARRPRGDEGAG